MQSREQAGLIKRWDDDKGYGFIQPDTGGAEVFVHVSAMRGDRRPQAGDPVLFLARRDARGRWCAEHLRLADRAASDPPGIRARSRSANPARKLQSPDSIGQPSAAMLLVFVGACLLPVMGTLHWLAAGRVWLSLFYPLASALCFALYWQDKRSARRGQRRIAERTLHLVELAGGWPGAWLAQQAFRHKTRKASYQLTFWIIVALHQLYWVDQLWLDGAYGSDGWRYLARWL